MNSFKDGSPGNLPFGDDDGDNDGTNEEQVPTQDEQQSHGDEGKEAKQSAVGAAEEDESHSRTSESAQQYPYFLRRSTVGDERNTRLELKVRDKVSDLETEARKELAEGLGMSEISKTDAREFALLAAYKNPEIMVELMEEEGFGAV